MSERISVIIRASVVTLLSLLLLTVSIGGISVLSLFSPLEGDADFQLSDLYVKVADKSHVSQCSDEVVVLATDGCSRMDIVRLVEAVDSFSPAVIGVDVNFQYPSEDDSYMLSVFENCRSLVLPLIVSYNLNSDAFSAEPQINSFLTTLLDRDFFSVVNMERHGAFGAVRTFRPLYNVDDIMFPSFPVKLAESVDSTRTREFLKRNLKSEYISYQSRTFETLHYEDIFISEDVSFAEVASMIKGKVIIMGDLQNSKDFFPVPHKDVLPGALIHAHCVDTILSGNHIDVMPSWMNVLMSILLCFVFSYMFIRLEIRLDVGVDFLIRVLQILLMFILYWVGCVFFVHGYYVDVSLVLLMFVTSTLSKDICVGIEQIYVSCKKKFNK